MSKDDGTCNRDYFIQQYPDLADVFLPKTKAQQSFAQPTARKPKKPIPAMKADVRMEGKSIVLTLPLPPKELSPNGGTAHWGTRAKAIGSMRTMAKMLTSRMATSEWLGCAVRLDACRWADKRMDSDNFWSACKSLRDGIADGLMTTDAQFELGTIEQITGKASEGRREVEIRVSRLP